MVKRGVDGTQYWGDKPPKELTVGYMTTAVGAIQAGYAEGWITGASSMPHQRFLSGNVAFSWELNSGEKPKRALRLDYMGRSRRQGRTPSFPASPP
jgi:hypothetical protein